VHTIHQKPTLTKKKQAIQKFVPSSRNFLSLLFILLVFFTYSKMVVIFVGMSNRLLAFSLLFLACFTLWTCDAQLKGYGTLNQTLNVNQTPVDWMLNASVSEEKYDKLVVDGLALGVSFWLNLSWIRLSFECFLAGFGVFE
jgi:hypothetical protein